MAFSQDQEKPVSKDRIDPTTMSAQPHPVPQPEPDDELRMYIIVRRDIGDVMSKAKFGVQCGHAALICFVETLKLFPDKAWAYYNNHQPKIVLACKDTDALLGLLEKSVKAGFTSEFVRDLGRTEFGEETLTALVVGPVWYMMEAQKSFLRGLPRYKDPPHIVFTPTD
jgi:peptidyl-tRNA hydrolase, PTH2 family